MGKRATFTKAEITRAISAFKEAGLAVTRCEIGRDGSIVLSTGPTVTTPANDYEAWKAKRK